MISPLADGLVSAVLVDVGDHVEANQVLARFDPVLARHDLATAEASLAEGMAQLREAERRRDEAAEVHAEELIAGTIYEAAVAEAVRMLDAVRPRRPMTRPRSPSPQRTFRVVRRPESSTSTVTSRHLPAKAATPCPTQRASPIAWASSGSATSTSTV